QPATRRAGDHARPRAGRCGHGADGTGAPARRGVHAGSAVALGRRLAPERMIPAKGVRRMGVSSQIETNRRAVPERRPELGLYAPVSAVTAFILTAPFLLLVFTPFELSRHTTTTQFLILAAGLCVMLAANAALLRLSLAPLRRLTELMTT